MARVSRKNGHAPRALTTPKYDANNIVLDKTYGAFADLRRELADSKTAAAERAERLQDFAHCADPHRARLSLAGHLVRLSLSLEGFRAAEWAPRLPSGHR